MTGKELEIILKNKCETLNLKREAFKELEETLRINKDEEDFLCGYHKSEIQQRFDRFQFLIEGHYNAVIRSKIGLYIEGNSQKIGYYELETDFNGKILDDYFVITTPSPYPPSKHPTTPLEN